MFNFSFHDWLTSRSRVALLIVLGTPLALEADYLVPGGVERVAPPPPKKNTQCSLYWFSSPTSYGTQDCMFILANEKNALTCAATAEADLMHICFPLDLNVEPNRNSSPHQK